MPHDRALDLIRAGDSGRAATCVPIAAAAWIVGAAGMHRAPGSGRKKISFHEEP